MFAWMEMVAVNELLTPDVFLFTCALTCQIKTGLGVFVTQVAKYYEVCMLDSWRTS